MDIATYLEVERGIPTTRLGTYRVACCPFHSERTPSFYIYPDGHAYCFGGCSEDRSFFKDLIELIYRLEFPNDENRRRAIERAKSLGVEPKGRLLIAPQPINMPPPTPEQIKAMTIAFQVYHEFLFKRVGRKAINWLANVRHLDGPYMDLVLRTIGFSPQGAYYHTEVISRLRNAFGPDWMGHATTAGILSRRGGQRLQDRIIFGVFEGKQRNRVTYFQGRTLDATNTDYKYLNAPGIRKALYEPIPSEEAAYPGTRVCEGAPDAAAYGACGFYAVGVLGSHLKIDKLKSLPQPLIPCFDNRRSDPAGRKAYEQFMVMCYEHGIPVLDDDPLPDGVKDPNELLEQVGHQRFTELASRVYAVA